MKYLDIFFVICIGQHSNKPLSFDTASYNWAGAGSGRISSCIEPRGHLIHQPFFYRCRVSR